VKGKSSSGTTKKDTGDPFLAVTRRKLVAKLRSTGGAEEELDQKIVILVRRQYQLVDVRICLLLEDLLSVCVYIQLTNSVYSRYSRYSRYSTHLPST
jgi:hypothetical protein